MRQIGCSIDGAKLRALREEQALSRYALSVLSGISANEIWNIEAERHRPYRYTVGRLARALGVDAGQFLRDNK